MVNGGRVGFGADLEGWQVKGITTLSYAREWNYQADQRMNGEANEANEQYENCGL